jgi:hypothetical protein
MSLYAQYIKQREGYETIEIPEGFVTYRIEGEIVYLRDAYMVPQSRKILVFDLADKVCEIGRSSGCKKMMASVSPIDPNATGNLKVLLHYGMKLHHATQELIFFEKEL